MNNILSELLDLLVEYEPAWAPVEVAQSRLKNCGDALIPGLIDCLADYDWCVRHLAINLLAANRPRSDVAVSHIIHRVADENRLVRAIAIERLHDFGSLAVQAIPHLEEMLDREDEYLWIIAVTLIVRLDPSRTDLLAEIRDAAKSDHPVVKEVAREFLRNR